MEVAINSFRPSKTLIQIPEQIVLPTSSEDIVEQVISTTTTSTVSTSTNE